MRLHGYFRSTASWRVRIVLGLKNISADNNYVKLRDGEQRAAAYLDMNPQGLVPALELDDGRVLTQSLAIIEYLDETHPEPPLLGRDPFERARVRSLAQIIACDVHPIQNLKILDRVRGLANDEAAQSWARTVIEDGLEAFEQTISAAAGPFCMGQAPTLADVVLVPQLANARRFGVEITWPRIAAVEAACMQIEAFQQAVPEAQEDGF